MFTDEGSVPAQPPCGFVLSPHVVLVGDEVLVRNPELSFRNH